MTAASDWDEYSRPSLAVDPVVMTVDAGQLKVVLWKRQFEPQAGRWALPGVFVAAGESLEQAVLRGLRDKTGIEEVAHLEQLFTWNKPGRDPRGWVVTVAHFALVASSRLAIAESRSASAQLFDVRAPVALRGGVKVATSAGRAVTPAFDHGQILARVVERLRADVWTTPVTLALLPDRFTLREMQITFEAILGRRVNKDSFRRRVTRTQALVAPTGDYQSDVDHRPAELYERAVAQDEV